MRTGEASRSPLTAEVLDWCENAPADAVRTLVLRLVSSADPDAARAAISAMGVTVASSGAGVIVADVACKDVWAVSDAPGVLSIEMPGRLHPKPEPSDPPDDPCA